MALVDSLGMTPMRLQYGVNEADGWRHFALGPDRERLWARLRELDVRIVRMFVFDKGTPDPVLDWPSLRAYIQAAINTGATPFLTFAKFRRPFDDPRAVRWFAEQCFELVWSCIEEWGGENVKNWYWCVWNEPNNDWIGGGIKFEEYRLVYEQVARGVSRLMAPWLEGGRPRIGGASVDGCQPFWLDWIWRLLHEIDNSLIGFVNWHYYADWRDFGEAGAPGNPRTMQSLILAQTHQYGLRAAQVARLLRARNVLHICGEWNAHSNYFPTVRAQFNQTTFGAVYGAAALIQFLRSGMDAEMVWAGSDGGCGYGMLQAGAEPTPLFYAKRLCAGHVRYGDRLRFPVEGPVRREWDAVVSYGPNGRRSIFLVHLSNRPGMISIADLEPALAQGGRLTKIDATTNGRPVALNGHGGRIELEGYGVVVVADGCQAE